MGWHKIKLDPADIAFSRWIRLRDMECRRCSSPVRLNDKEMPVSHEASHFQGRGKESTRFEPLNVDTLCSGCHQYFTANPAEHYQWQLSKKGQKVVDKLILLSNTYTKKNRETEKIYWQKRLKEDYG